MAGSEQGASIVMVCDHASAVPKHLWSLQHICSFQVFLHIFLRVACHGTPLPLSHTHTHTLVYLCHTHTHTHTHTQVYLCHTHTHTHKHTHTHTHTGIPLPHTHSLSLSHTHTLVYLCHTHTHTHTHTLVYLCRPQAPILSSIFCFDNSYENFLKFCTKLLSKDCYRPTQILPLADQQFL
jgi:hypothetical protein